MITTMYSEESGRSSSYLPRKRHHENPSEEHSKRSRLHPREQHQNTNFVIPHGWLDCPRFGQDIGCIVPSKVPLSESYNDHLPPDKRYTFKQWMTNNNGSRKKLGLVIDLTNTARYYNPSTELRREGIEYVKIRCSGRDSVPDNVSVNTFVHEVNRFERRNVSKKFVLVHCTHGHNRTGFMVVHYLMRSRAMMSVTQAIKTFYDARPPGIYKADYIDALYSFYHEVKPESAVCPPTPEWKRSENESLSPPCVPSLSVQEIKKMSNDDVLGDEIPYSQEKCYQEFCYEMMNIKMEGRSSSQFPGSHPVSLDREGFQLLRRRYYYATWKADGTRYMMLLTREGCYLIDRKFRFRRVQMRFPCKPHEPKVHDYTLLDGEMVVDNFLDGERKPCQARRYLVYDMVAVNGESIADRPFSERWSVTDREVIRPRNDEKKVANNNGYRYEMEPFGVRIKAFCLLSAVEKKVFNELIPSLSHESDGIILQGWDDPYVYQRNQGLFKWKFLDSIDFLFEVGKDGRYMLFLYDNGRNKVMEGHTVEFRGDGWEHPVSYYSGKLLECFWDKEDRVWVAMRVRVDKSQPNGMGTFRGVMKSINDNITKEVLLEEIKEIIRLPMYVERIRMDTLAAERRRHGNRKGC